MSEEGRWYSGAVYDALHELDVPNALCVLPRNIKPLAHDMQMYGPALLCYGRRCIGEDYAVLDRNRLEIYAHVAAGCVLVLQAEDDAVAHAGDVGLLICQRQGAVGFVTDGNVRDARRIIEMGFPCFAAGITPIDAIDYWAWISIVDWAQIKGVPFERGDWVFGDADGVLRIPGKLREQVEEKVRAKVAQEDQVRRWISEARGPSRITSAARQAYDRFGRW